MGKNKRGRSIFTSFVRKKWWKWVVDQGRKKCGRSIFTISFDTKKWWNWLVDRSWKPFAPFWPDLMWKNDENDSLIGYENHLLYFYKFWCEKWLKNDSSTRVEINVVRDHIKYILLTYIYVLYKTIIYFHHSASVQQIIKLYSLR